MEYSKKVIIEKDVKLKFKDSTNIDDLAKEFSSFMFQVTTDEFIEFICVQLCNNPTFIEGIGRVEWSPRLSFDWADKETVLVYDLDFINSEVE
jgi:hypothetical protein